MSAWGCECLEDENALMMSKGCSHHSPAWRIASEVQHRFPLHKVALISSACREAPWGYQRKMGGPLCVYSSLKFPKGQAICFQDRAGLVPCNSHDCGTLVLVSLLSSRLGSPSQYCPLGCDF